MYICLECGHEFSTPAKLTEKHALSTPPYEILSVCPRCKTTSFKKGEVNYCHCCGAKNPPSKSGYCSEKCKAKGEKLWKKEMKRKKLLSDSSLFQLVREVEEYNRNNKTKLSYGQYVALVKTACKGKNANAKR